MARKGGRKERWSVDELKTLWENRHLPVKELANLIPTKTEKAIKNYKGNFSRLDEEKIEFILKNHKNMAASEIDDQLELVRGTTCNYLRMIGKEFLFRPNSWSEKEIETLERYAGIYTYQQIADMLGVSEARIRNMASKLGIHSGYRYSIEEKKIALQMRSQGKSAEEIAQRIGRSVGSVRNFFYREGVINSDELESIYRVSKPENYIMEKISKEFGIEFPDKSDPKNRDYYWGIIPPYEVDIPFEINGRKFAIEYDGQWWHEGKEEKAKEKEKLLGEKGYLFFRITSNHHQPNKVETLDPILDVIFQVIRQLARSKGTSNDYRNHT